MTTLRLCAGTLTVADAEESLLGYLDPGAGNAWPSYDQLETNGSEHLVSADLLAPVLLGAHVDEARFRLLTDLLPDLQGVAELPHVELGGADDEVLEQVADLFGVVDREAYRRRGLRGTILSKVLHRKRPDLVPLYDSRIYAAYTAEGGIPRETHRAWREFMGLLLHAMREDLRQEADGFARLVEVAAEEGAELTPLRILDILVWTALEGA